MILKCAIVDDEPLAVELLASYVNKIPFMQLAGKYYSATEAMKDIAGGSVDVIFLDIQMQEINQYSMQLEQSHNISINLEKKWEFTKVILRYE